MELKRLHAVHREIIRLYVLGNQYSEIATEVGVTLPTVTSVVNSELGQLIISDMQRELDAQVVDVGKALVEGAAAGEQFLLQVANGSLEAPISLRAKVCMDQLDRAGYAKVTRNINVDLAGALSADDIHDIKAKARGMLNVVEAEVVDDGR